MSKVLMKLVGKLSGGKPKHLNSLKIRVLNISRNRKVKNFPKKVQKTLNLIIIIDRFRIR